MTKIVLTFAIEPHLVERIRSFRPDLDVKVLNESARQTWSSRGYTPYPSELQAMTGLEELTESLVDAEILFGFWGGAMAAMPDFRERAPKVRWVQLTSAGVDRLDPALIEAGIRFTTAGGLASVPIAEYVMAYILMFSKGWPRLFGNQQTRAWKRFNPKEVYGKTVGIVGMGYIGKEVALRAKAFGCRVLGMRRSFTERGPDEFADEAVPPHDLDYLLRESDFVVLAAPLTPETRQMIGRSQLETMKETAYLLNIGRGALVDEVALIDALREGRIAGAGLDVFETEPLPDESPLWELPNVIISPHIAGGTPIYNQRATDIFLSNLERYLAGETLINVVDTQRGY